MAAVLQAARARRAEIAALHVYHLGILIFTDTALDGAALEARAETEHTETHDVATIDDAFARLEAANPELAERGSDVRWGLVFTTSAGERVLAAYLDAHGAAGTIGDERVTYETPALVEWLRETYGADFVLSS